MKSDPLPTPFILPGEPISARQLSQLARVASRNSPSPGGFVNGIFSLQAPVLSEGTQTVIQGGGSVSIKVVLIDTDIEGIDEVEPQDFLTASDITLTEDQEGWEKKFQEPPDDDLTENWVDDDRLNLHRFRRRKLRLKVYGSSPITGTLQTYSGEDDEIKLSTLASNEDDVYNGDTITITDGTGEGQTRTILDFIGSSRVATVDSPFDPETDNTSVYAITSSRDLALDYETVEDAVNERLIIRYKYIDVWYDDRKPFYVGEYTRADYPDFDENEAFPPEGLPEGFLNRKFRGIVVNGVLVTILCKPLPAPELPD